MPKIICLFSFVCLFLLVSCSVTPMLNIPAHKEHFVTAEPNPGAVFTGSWFDVKDGRTVTVTQADGQQKGVFSVSVLDKTNAGKDNIRPLPFLGIPVRYKGNRDLFFLVIADGEKIRKMAQTSELLGFALRPYFFLVRPTLQKDGKLEIAFVCWMKKENEKQVVTDPCVKVQGALVINSTEELIRLIEAQKYVLAEPRTLERKK